MMKPKPTQFKPVKAYDIQIGALRFSLLSGNQIYLWPKRRDAVRRARELDPEYDAKVVAVLITPIPSTSKAGKKKSAKK